MRALFTASAIALLLLAAGAHADAPPAAHAMAPFPATRRRLGARRAAV